jgi:hypothetical protein
VLGALPDESASATAISDLAFDQVSHGGRQDPGVSRKVAVS